MDLHKCHEKAHNQNEKSTIKFVTKTLLFWFIILVSVLLSFDENNTPTCCMSLLMEIYESEKHVRGRVSQKRPLSSGLQVT